MSNKEELKKLWCRFVDEEMTEEAVAECIVKAKLERGNSDGGKSGQQKT